MTTIDNDALTALHRIWHHEADWMICQGCNCPIIASRDGEELVHKDGCKYANEHHPWSQLRVILGAAPKPSKLARNDYPTAFEEVWAMYPVERQGTKRTAFKAWNANIKRGVEPAEIANGLRRYLAHAKAIGTEMKYLRLAATFFGPDEHFAAAYVMPSAQRAQLGAAGQATATAAQEWLRSRGNG